MNSMKTILRMTNKENNELTADYNLSDVIKISTESLYNEATEQMDMYYSIFLTSGISSFGINRWFISFF